MVDRTAQDVIDFVRSLYPHGGAAIPLHAPVFQGREKQYVVDCLDSTFVSSIGPYVIQLEEMIRDLTGAAYAIATNCGTAALHAALLTAGVQPGDEVLTQPVSFVATANAIAYCGARPVFIDVDKTTLGLDPLVLDDFFATQTSMGGGVCRNRYSGRRIAACVPMHTFGHPCAIEAIVEICAQHHVPVIEDAAEAVGSVAHNRACGTFGLAGVLSFNGNKIVTSGGGGMLITNDDNLAAQARHITTTAKKPHPYWYEHTEVGYNYRMPNINAALCCGQLEQLDHFLQEKRRIANAYEAFFRNSNMHFVAEPVDTRSNYWLNSVLVRDESVRDDLLERTNAAGIMTRPIWALLNRLPMFATCQTHGGSVAEQLAERTVNLPSGVPS